MGRGAPSNSQEWHYKWRCRECKTVEDHYRDARLHPCRICGSPDLAEKIVTRRVTVGLLKFKWEIRESSEEEKPRMRSAIL